MPTIIELVHSIEHDYGSLHNAPDNDSRFKLTQKMLKPENGISKIDLNVAQRLLDSGITKTELGNELEISKDELRGLINSGKLDDSLWQAKTKRAYRYRYYLDSDLLATGTVNQISVLTDRTVNQIIHCNTSVYTKFAHKHTYRLELIK